MNNEIYPRLFVTEEEPVTNSTNQINYVSFGRSSKLVDYIHLHEFHNNGTIDDVSLCLEKIDKNYAAFKPEGIYCPICYKLALLKPKERGIKQYDIEQYSTVKTAHLLDKSYI